MNELRQQAIAIFKAGVAAADPDAAVTRALDTVARPALIIAVGKAARLMAKAALARFTGVLCLVVTNYENATDLPGAQVYAAGHPVPDQNGADAALAWVKAQDLARGPLVYATATPDSVKAAQARLGTAKAGEMIEAALAACGVAARDAGARRVIVAGGETSGAVTKALGITQLDIGREIAPGVPWTFCQSAGHRIALTLKSGNFGTETFFSHAQELLETS